MDSPGHDDGRDVGKRIVVTMDTPEMIECWTDGSAYPPYPGPAGMGAVGKVSGQVVFIIDEPVFGERIGLGTHNEAEYKAAISALRQAIELGARRAILHTDSDLVVKHFAGSSRCSAENLVPLLNSLRELAAQFEDFRIECISSEENREADELAAAGSRKAQIQMARGSHPIARGSKAAEPRALKEWGPGDGDAAVFVWSGMSARARKLFQVLLGTADKVPWDRLAKVLGPGAREDTVYGTFGGPAKLAKAVERMPPTRGGTKHGGLYWLQPNFKALLTRALLELGPRSPTADGLRA